MRRSRQFGDNPVTGCCSGFLNECLEGQRILLHRHVFCTWELQLHSTMLDLSTGARKSQSGLCRLRMRSTSPSDSAYLVKTKTYVLVCLLGELLL